MLLLCKIPRAIFRQKMKLASDVKQEGLKDY